MPLSAHLAQGHYLSHAPITLPITRTMRAAAKSIAAIPAESIPFIGVAVLIADTRYEFYAACETVRDLDQTFFWTVIDLENKLRDYQIYYNENRTHSGRDGSTPTEATGSKIVDINKYHWEKHCRGLFKLPMVA